MVNEEQLKILKKGVKAWNNWRRENPEIKPELHEANLLEFDLAGVNLKEAELSGVNLKEAELSGANLTRADLRRANLAQAKINGASFEHANLKGAILSGAEAGGLYVGTEDTEPRVTNFTGADLSDVYFSYTDISYANFSHANLTNSYLIATRAIDTNFEGAIFTGACIHDWHINDKTILENIYCDYIHLKFAENSERRPSDPNRNFEPGEFAKLVEKYVETVDLIFTDGIDWKAFLTSFQDLRVEYGEQNVSIQAIEKKSDGAFVIRLSVPPEADKAEVESKAKESYETNLKILEAQYRAKLEAKDEQIAIYRQQNTDLLGIIRLKANQPITENHFHGSVGSVDNKGTQTNIAGEVKGNQSSE